MRKGGGRLRYAKVIFKSLIVIFAALLLVLIPLLLQGKDSSYHSPVMFAMDTTLEITLQGRGNRAKTDVKEAYALVKEIESKTSRFLPQSDVSKINRMAGISPVKVSSETLYIIERSIHYSEITNGALDITIAPVMKLWGFYDGKYRVPKETEISIAKKMVNWKKIVVNEKEGTVMLAEKGMEIDLGAVAKGYAVDAVVNKLRSRGVKHGLVNFGGTIGTIGLRTDRKKWVIGIRNPRGEATSLLGEIELVDGFVASSGDYERFFTKNGKRYFHIFDPSTGHNPEGTMSTTVVGKNGLECDALSTALIVLGKEKGISLVERIPNLSCILVDNNGRVEKSKGIQKYVLELKEKVR